MGVIYKTDKRRVIPRWRSLKISSITGELGVTSKKSNPNSFNTDVNLVEQKQAWDENKNLFHAGDLLSSASVLGLESEFKKIAEFIIEKEQDHQAPLFKLAIKVLGGEMPLPENKNVVTNEIIPNPLKYRPEIKKFKSYLNSEPKNPIAWVELGRLYSLVGNVAKAQRCIDNALALEKDNRFIVRSASRFYHHYHTDKDIALHIIKNSSFIKNDPWLISAEIAYSSILNRHSKMAKIGVDLLKNYNGNYSSITELASSLGTLEFTEGKIKNAKNYFKQSLIQPNDNSLAQASWMSESINGLALNINKYDLPLAYEAKAHVSYHEKEYQNSFDDAMRWQQDEPYSTRPIRLASYVAGTFLNKTQEAIRLIKLGLEINPHDTKLINNLVYFLAEENQLEEAISRFESDLRKSLINPNDTSIVSITATAGLLLFRSGNFEEGRDYYQKAIKLAKQEKNNYLVALATANLAKEELRVTKNADSLINIINQLNLACKDIDEPDVKILYKKVLFDFENLKNKL